MLLVALPCTSQMRTNSSRADLAPMFVPVVFVLMPSGSFDSFCYNLDVSRFQILWFPSSWLVLIFVTGDIALFPKGAALPVHKINASSQHNLLRSVIKLESLVV